MQLKVALAGQPKCGKSTIFNMLSGIHHLIANYPGVTVDKKSGFFNVEDIKIEMVDLPGTYSFSSYSLEEKVAKEFLINEKPDVILNVVDASNLKRNLYLTFQLLEIGIPVVVILNMCDVAKNRGILIDTKKMSEILNCTVIECSARKGIGKDEILEKLKESSKEEKQNTNFSINYENLEDSIKALYDEVQGYDNKSINKRWLSIKALESDTTIIEELKSKNPSIEDKIKEIKENFNKNSNQKIDSFLASFRYENSEILYHKCVKETNNKQTLTDKIDKFILNRWLSFPILLAIVFFIYESSIDFGYKLTNYTWPIFASIKNFVIDILPKPDIATVPMITDLGVWLVNSALALLNYLPIFFILFAMIAILEDVGYMPRMAFILDKVFKKFGLHGQSTLPLVLGGAFVGGCAVPGVMSTKGIADDRARMATILTVPLMNCLAKVPFYTLLLGAFFPHDMSIMLFYISTATVLAALIIAKLLTSTILKSRETAPFVMELPPYHLPTFKGVILRSCERVWVYIKKVCSIVIAVAIVLFALLQFPGLSKQKQDEFKNKETLAINYFQKNAKDTKYYESINTREKISNLLNFYDGYKAKKMAGKSNVDKEYKEKNKEFYKFIRPKAKDIEAKKINKLLRKLSRSRKSILRQQKNYKIENSLLGMAGRALVPISQYAGFDWKTNVAFLSSFAARESAVATLGSIYENGKDDSSIVDESKMRAEDKIAKNSGYTPLHAASIIIFMLLTPPCIATMIVVKMQTNSYGWMCFGMFFPFGLALLVSSMFFTISTSFALTGLTAMGYYYLLLLILVSLLGLLPERQINWNTGNKNKS